MDTTVLDFADLYEQAHQAGLKAGAECRPIPMLVQQALGLTDKFDPSRPYEMVDDGACGFAWIKVKPANSPFAKWLKKWKSRNNAYGGGVDIWVSHFGQSIDRKAAYAGAFAAVLKAAGINCYADSRLD